MNAEVLDVIADRFTKLGALAHRSVRDDLQPVKRHMRDLMDSYSRYACPNDAECSPVFVVDSVGRVEDFFVAKVSIDGVVPAAVIRYWPGD